MINLKIVKKNFAYYVCYLNFVERASTYVGTNTLQMSSGPSEMICEVIADSTEVTWRSRGGHADVQ